MVPVLPPQSEQVKLWVEALLPNTKVLCRWYWVLMVRRYARLGVSQSNHRQGYGVKGIGFDRLLAVSVIQRFLP